MDFKDIVNRDIVNLQNCESEPIHIPGSIQPHGYLMGCSKATLQIEYCSENCIDFSGLDYKQLLSKNIADVFDLAQVEKIKERIAQLHNENLPPLLILHNGLQYNTVIHTSGENYIIELEPVVMESLVVNDLYTQTKKFVALMNGAVKLKDLCQGIAEETRALTGFDRVMVYRFDKEYNGEVIAESKKDEFEPFLGLHYPHTDIPVQARHLYLTNLLRLIVDVHYKPVPIYTIDDIKQRGLDLSHAIYRSVSPIHVAYLKNMGVGGTLTISLLHQNKLWGLITCHHYSAINISPYTKIAAQLQGHFLTSQIDVRQIAEQYDRNLEIERSFDTLSAKIPGIAKGNIAGLAEQAELLNLTCASGVAVMVDGVLHLHGTTPADKEVRYLITWLGLNFPAGVYSSYKLRSAYGHDKHIYEQAAGIVYHSLGKPGADCIVWFKPEIEKTVNWAGDPSKAIEKDENGLSPRQSFALWRENRKFESSEWSESELSAAARFATSLQKQINVLNLEEEEHKYRKLNEKLKKANSELEGLNWIFAHDLKEPLRKIQTFSSIILNNDEADLFEERDHAISRMDISVKKMQRLINDILAYTQVSNKDEAFTGVDLNLVCAGVVNEIKEELTAAGAVVETGKLPLIKGLDFQIRQLLFNLLTNSLKFARKGVSPIIKITCITESLPAQADDDTGKNVMYSVIKITDNGIGFSNIYAQRIMEVFQRLHTEVDYKGTGIGLAICKKIMENHDGFIAASGEENVGATFSLYFPVSILS